MAAKDIQSAALSKVNTSVVHAIGGTKVKETKKLFKWTIKNYSAWQDRGLEKDYMTSPTFSTGANDESKWCFQIKHENTYVCMYITLVSSNKAAVHARTKVDLLDLGKIIRTVEEPRFAKLCKGSYIKQYIGPLGLKDAETTILCEITKMEIVNISEQAQIMHRNAIRGKLSENLGTLLNNEKFSDVTLVASGLEVRAHKSILAARSDVFAAMFEHEMEENKLNRVVIKDIDHNVLKDMLKFVYTGTAPNLDTMSSDLLAAANKYGLEDLKALCADAISTKLSVNNSAKTLVLADIYDAGQLKADTIAYIKNHIADVMETQDWQDMTKTHSYLVGDVLRAFAKQ